jgi:ABC-2 type transport system ATP-binding protein
MIRALSILVCAAKLKHSRGGNLQKICLRQLLTKFVANPHNSAPLSLEVNNVTKYYGKQAALKNVSFSVKRGEVVGFLGPNGAGKSTMMKIITCYLPPSEGKVTVEGHDIYDESIKVRRRVGYLPENNPLYPEMYIREYLRFVAGIYRVKNGKSRVEEVIEMVGLTLESHKRIGALSKGYRQRVGLAQALIHDPEVLILDEPTSGLDPNQLDDIRKLIKKIGREKTVLLSTHIMQEVEAICNRAIIIKLGEIVADKPVHELKSASGKAVYFLHVEGSVKHSKIMALGGVEKVTEDVKGKYRITATEHANLGPSLTALAASEGCTIQEMRREARSLEDAFKSLTRE